jgi:hypothetical protein
MDQTRKSSGSGPEWPRRVPVKPAGKPDAGNRHVRLLDAEPAIRLRGRAASNWHFKTSRAPVKFKQSD